MVPIPRVPPISTLLLNVETPETVRRVIEPIPPITDVAIPDMVENPATGE